ncbi:hypothetical protein EKG37_22205 [Robertmurraya yapensis]|uniref:Poly A polymerase head domain-containing protein n=1 Tax=Bacillus yapensis TaxID=2492960 RepID=A0A431VS24_9BACI|nr:hypothetical protein [Bacillus yapensis]RTR25949.1 hypothetical protein EKG37_22205 [Bacillus yapensis]TKS93528.1 hypothetical protein FAR12_22210 [Bacillus yapensis]
MSRYEKNIKNQLIYFLGKDSRTLNFIEELSNVGDLLFFGGSIRDICLFPDKPPMPRDFDIAINFKNKDIFDSIINKYKYKMNRFGGYKIKISNLEFDIWDLENTWAFKYTNLSPSEENLAKSVYLNIDGIVYNFNKSLLYDEIFRSSVRECKLDITLEENPQIELNLLRAMVFKEKYNLNFSKKLKQVYQNYLNESEKLVENLYELQLSHYKVTYLSKEEIKNELQYI